MRKSALILVSLILLAAPAAAQSGWKKLNGQKAPAITAKEWINAGKKAPDLASLRGKVILLEFMATW